MYPPPSMASALRADACAFVPTIGTSHSASSPLITATRATPLPGVCSHKGRLSNEEKASGHNHRSHKPKSSRQSQRRRRETSTSVKNGRPPHKTPPHNVAAVKEPPGQEEQPSRQNTGSQSRRVNHRGKKDPHRSSRNPPNNFDQRQPFHRQQQQQQQQQLAVRLPKCEEPRLHDDQFENYYDLHQYQEYSPREDYLDEKAVNEHFPILSEVATSTADAPGIWANTASLLSDLTSPLLQEEGMKTTGETEFRRDRGNLTILTPLRKKKGSPESPLSSAARDGVSLEVLETSFLSREVVMKRKTRSMEKLRDRWWEILKNRPLPSSISQDIQEEEGNETDASSGDESFEESLVTIPRSEDLRKSLSNSRLDEAYSNVKFPLHEAVQRNDELAVRLLMERGAFLVIGNEDGTCMDPLQLAVHLGRPRMLRIFLAAGPVRSFNEENTTSRWPPAPCMAAVKGHRECLVTFLEASTTNLLARDSRGNTVLHLLCRKKSSSSNVSLCCYYLRAEASSSLIGKLFCQKNNNGQTPLHMACSHGRSDLVELILDFASLNLLSKVLAIQDGKRQTPLLAAIASTSTDAVMSLLMWSGNNNLAIQKVEANTPSPLVWAVKVWRVETVVLLLDFFDSSENKDELDAALRLAVESRQGNKAAGVKMDIIRHLVKAGANPCSEVKKDKSSSLEVAAHDHDEGTLRVLLDTFEDYLQTAMSTRRRNPTLQSQPESYFEGIESRERAQLRVALRDALVKGLESGWKSKAEAEKIEYESCSILLFEKGAVLDAFGLDMLRGAFQKTCLSRLRESAEMHFSTRTSQPHFPGDAISVGRLRKGSVYTSDDVNHQSRVQWSIEGLSLCWCSEAEHDHFFDLHQIGDCAKSKAGDCDVVLVTDDGMKFEAHSVLLSARSAKFEAAYRFAHMQGASEDARIEIIVPTTGNLCHLMLQHLYYDSIVTGLPEKPDQCCDVLLDLAVLAESMVCESLIQEVEVRLLSENPRACYCYSCSRKGEYSCFGPSTCVNAATVLDIIATAEHIDEFISGLSYRIRIPSPSSERGTLEFSPFGKLRQIASIECMSDFQRVVESEAFQSQLSDLSGEHSQFKRMLLRCCLEEFVHALDGSGQSNRRGLETGEFDSVSSAGGLSC